MKAKKYGMIMPKNKAETRRKNRKAGKAPWNPVKRSGALNGGVSHG